MKRFTCDHVCNEEPERCVEWFVAFPYQVVDSIYMLLPLKVRCKSTTTGLTWLITWSELTIQHELHLLLEYLHDQVGVGDADGSAARPVVHTGSRNAPGGRHIGSSL